jgi:hypothetical protein
MPKKAKKDNKKSNVKKIPAKAGAKARVSRDGKVEVILPVDRSRGAYKPRKTEEQKIQERINQLRSQERKEYSRQVLAPESVSGSYRRGGSIYRSDVSAPSGGFTGIVSSKENKKLKEVNEKLDKLLAKEKKEKKEKKPEQEETEPKPAETELQQVSNEIVRSNIRRGIESRDRRQRQIQAEERAKRDEEKKKIEQSRVRVATRKLREEKTAQEQSRVAEEERQQKIEAQQRDRIQKDKSRQSSTRDRRLDEREREQRLRESSRELELISQKEKADAHKRREEAESKRAFTGARNLYKSKLTERNQLVDDIMGGEKEKTISLQAERNIEKEKRELDRRQKALQDEQNRKDKEEAFKLQEKIDRERKAVKQKERQKLVTEAHALKKQDEDIDDLFSELEKAPKKEVEVKELEPEVETDDEDFVDVVSEEPDEPDKEDEQDIVVGATHYTAEARKQILQDQEIARDLLRHDARKKDRKIKEEQERINKLSKLNETFIEHRNREDRNKRRRQQREDREKLSKSAVGQAFSSAIIKQSQEEEERDKPPRSKRGRKPAKVTQQSVVALIKAGATRGEIEENDIRLQNIEVIIRGLFTGFGITLPREYRTASKKIRTQIRIDSVRKLRDRGFSFDQILEFTRLLDELNEEIRLRDKFGNLYQRRREEEELGERVGKRVRDIEEKIQEEKKWL